MLNELDILIDIDRRLSQISVPYMLTGSFAMNYYAEPRMTRDIDVVIAVNYHLKDRIYEALKDDYYVPEQALDEALRHRSMFNIIHCSSVIKVDFIINKGDAFGVNTFERRQQIKINDHKISMISKEDLIISKIRWSSSSRSEQQKKDILNLLKTGYDKEYVKAWLLRCGLLSFAEEFINERYFT